MDFRHCYLFLKKTKLLNRSIKCKLVCIHSSYLNPWKLSLLWARGGCPLPGWGSKSKTITTLATCLLRLALLSSRAHLYTMLQFNLLSKNCDLSNLYVTSKLLFVHFNSSKLMPNIFRINCYIKLFSIAITNSPYKQP